MKRWTFLLSLTLIVTLSSLAQETTPLILDSLQQGQLDETTPGITYSFASDAGNILIEIRSSGALIPAYTLTDANNAPIAENTNENRDFALNDAIQLSQLALYHLTIEGLDNTLGEFSLIIHTSPSFLATPIPDLDCEVIIEQSIDIIDNICQNTGRNEVCYGNLSVFADVRENLPISFSQTGDIVPLSLVDTLLLSALNPDRNEWGVALMQVQADLPDTLPGQNVAVLIFGNVQVQDSDMSTMQSFYFTPGAGTSRCNDVTSDGILIRTPDGVASVNLRVNEVDISLGSTAFLMVEPDQTLDIIMLEGKAEVTVFEQTTTVNTGQRIRVPVDGESLPVDEPEEPEDVDLEEFLVLPVGGLLPSAPEPSQPIPTPLPTAIATSTPEPTATPLPRPTVVRPPLPATGQCVLRTASEGQVNVRTAPTVDGQVAGFLRPEQLYTVIGTNPQRDWYQLEAPTGWVAGFVTQRGGDCANLPVMGEPQPEQETPREPPPTEEPTPFTEVDPLDIVVDFNAPMRSYSGTISTFDQDLNDTIRYRFANVPGSTSYHYFKVMITCTTVQGARVTYDFNGTLSACGSTPAIFEDWQFSPTGSGTIQIYFAIDTVPATVTWTVSLGFQEYID